ncbi:MAG: NADH-quinone oxidoreductase subunit B [Thermoprotei archaeon]|nr:MAG: NADH-quinone oxidoreductase subunit B [Thermoprotei archaeon]
MSSIFKKIISWSRGKSLWLVHYCSACGAIEFPPVVTSPLDWERYGYMPTPTPRQSDFYAGMGYLTKKSVKLFLRVYRQMPNPKYVVAGCNCTATGGLYWDSYATYKRLDDFVKVSGWIPGCMPLADDWFSVIVDLYDKVAKTPPEHKGDPILPDAYEKIRKWEELEREWAKEYEEKMKNAEIKITYKFEETYDKCSEEYEDLRICVTNVKKERIREVLKELAEKGYKLFMNINTVDLPKEGVIEVYYIVANVNDGSQIWVKTFVPRNDPVIDSVHDIHPIAYYIEKEVHEMMGVEFKGHPDLSKWILDENWEGPPPHRKDVNTHEWVAKVYYGGYKYGR